MTQNEIRTGFNQIIKAAQAAGNQDAIARMELAREYFASDAFKKALQDHVWSITTAGA